jgi:tripartite-type tricarboxylate transporter receptor subunit TctC
MKIQIFRHNQTRHPQGQTSAICAFLLIASLAILVLPANSGAKDWPTKTVSLIIPWPAGGAVDLSARVLAPQLSKILEVPVQVVNKPGGSGMAGTLEAVKAPPDGYTLLMDCNGTSSIQDAWVEKLPYKVEERTYIARVTAAIVVLLVPGTSPFKTMEDVVKAIKENPASISFGNIGGTGVPDAATAQFRAALTAKGIEFSKIRMVTYKGSGETLMAVAGGHLSASMTTIGGTQPFLDAGKIRALAVTSAQRYKHWPTVPTMIELGYPSVNMFFWAGLSGPPGIPANIAKILENAAKQVDAVPDVVEKLDKTGLEPFYLSGDAYRKFVFDEAKTLKDLKLR